MTHDFTLNENQNFAINWKDGPILVLAGPGSGKTAVLTIRIANLIQQTPEDNFRVLGLTFTVKAANEMSDRIAKILGENNKRVQIRTFHSFCADFLRQHGSHVGLKPDFTIITDDKDRLAILNDNTNSTLYDEEDLKRIDVMLTHGITPDDLDDFFNEDQKDECEELKDLFNNYTNQLISLNQVDFSSMLYFSRKVFSNTPRVQKQINITYKYVCVDEFQDTNPAQYMLLNFIAPTPSPNLFVVADDDQIIFQWNGADPKRLDELKSDYTPTIVQLPENYRCPSNVVDIANKLISYNTGRSQNKSFGTSVSNSTGNITLESYHDFKEEISGLSHKISRIPSNLRHTCLVIARTNKLLEDTRASLIQDNINAEIVSKQQEFNSPLTQLIYYFLKTHIRPTSKRNINNLCTVTTKISGLLISSDEILATSDVTGQSVLLSYLSLLSTDPLLLSFTDIAISFLNGEVQFQDFIDKSFESFKSELPNSHSDMIKDFSTDRIIWRRISEKITVNHGSNVKLHTFIQEMDLTPKPKNLSNDCVRMQTVHTAKGAEFENVFVIGLAEEQFPTYFAIRNGSTAIEEERRNCFVAITRCSKNLFLSYAEEYNGWNKKPSRFLNEMGLLT